MKRDLLHFATIVFAAVGKAEQGTVSFLDIEVPRLRMFPEQGFHCLRPGCRSRNRSKWVRPGRLAPFGERSLRPEKMTLAMRWGAVASVARQRAVRIDDVGRPLQEWQQSCRRDLELWAAE